MRVWVWVGLLWSDRVRLVLEHYGDRITDVSIFGWRVGLDGRLSETFDPTLLDPYRAMWPHLRFWAAFRNDGDPAVFAAVRENQTARGHLLADLNTVLSNYPWLSGIDIDLEQGGGPDHAADAEGLFAAVATLAHSRGAECAAALPPLTSEGSVGGEDWVHYEQLGQILDRVEIMSYDFSWAGSAPGPVSPGYWMEDVYAWVVSQIDPAKVTMGIPLYARYWQLFAKPADIGQEFRGDSGTYYAAWQNFTGYRAFDGTDSNPAGSGSHHRIGWLAFRDPDSRSLWGYQDVYDWRDASAWDSASGIIGDTFEGKPYSTRYGVASGDPLWSVADNSDPSAHGDYGMVARKVRDVDGVEVDPKVGYTVTVELLQREPVAATIIDDNAARAGQLDDLYLGSWSHWESDGYGQYRGSGDLLFDHDFTGDALYVQARLQFATAGWSGVTVRGVTAEINSDGSVRLRDGATTVATGSGPAVAPGSAPGAGQVVIGLRVRGSTARVYVGRSETRVARLIDKTTVSPSGGDVGLVAESETWVDHVYAGDGWWYQPREAVEVTIGSSSQVLGRISRTGVTWDSQGRFRPDTDVDEVETRSRDVELDWIYEHWRDVAVSTGVPVTVRVQALDHDTWVGRILLLDRDGAGVVFWADPQMVVHWADRARFGFGVAGVAMWQLGQEDVRLWERLAGGVLPPETKVLNV